MRIWVHACMDAQYDTILRLIQCLEDSTCRQRTADPQWEGCLHDALKVLCERHFTDKSWSLELALLRVIRIVFIATGQATSAWLREIWNSLLLWNKHEPIVALLDVWITHIVEEQGTLQSGVDVASDVAGPDVTGTCHKSGRFMMGSCEGILLIDKFNNRLALYSRHDVSYEQCHMSKKFSFNHVFKDHDHPLEIESSPKLVAWIETWLQQPAIVKQVLGLAIRLKEKREQRAAEIGS